MATNPSDASPTTRRRLSRLALPPRSPGDWLLIAVIVCALLAVCLALLTRALTPAPGQPQRLIGQPAPTLSLPVAQSQVRLDTPQTIGGPSVRPTVLIFFNTLCVHCLSGVETGASLATATNAPSVVFVDTPGENAQITGQYMARLGINPPVALDTGARAATAYHVAYYPTAVLLDRQGIVRGVWTGALDAATIQAAVAHLT